MAIFPRMLGLGWMRMALVLWPVAALRADEPVQLQECFRPGDQWHVSSRVDLSGTLSLPPREGQAAARSLAVTGVSAIDYDERVLALAGNGQVQKTARIYRRVDFRRSVGAQRQQNTIRPAVRRLVILRRKQLEVPFSPDGPLTWNEMDLVHTDVFTPALAGLLPGQPVRMAARWTAAQAAVQELTDLERIDEGQVECRLEDVLKLQQRRQARVAFKGSVRGLNEDGPNRQELEGYFFFDLESNHLSYLYLKGVSILLDKDSKAVGKIEGRFVLTRQTNVHCPDLADKALRGVTLEPTADNTLLLYDNPGLGIRFLYPRHWHVARVRGRQVALDDAQENGLLLTVEAAGQVPSAAQFLRESRAYLKQQKMTVFRAYGPERLQAAPRELKHFSLSVETAGKRVVMDYYVLRQPAGGATLAARLVLNDLGNRQKEIERLARSLAITRPISAKANLPEPSAPRR